mgnify:CR=1 FL=1
MRATGEVVITAALIDLDAKADATDTNPVEDSGDREAIGQDVSIVSIAGLHPLNSISACAIGIAQGGPELILVHRHSHDTGLGLGVILAAGRHADIVVCTAVALQPD